MSSQASTQPQGQTAPAAPSIKAPKKITRLADLAHGRLIFEEFMGLKGEQRDNMLVYAPHAIQDNKRTKGASVWILITDEYLSQHFHAFQELRKRLASQHYSVQGTVIAERDTIRTLYDNEKEGSTGSSSSSALKNTTINEEKNVDPQEAQPKKLKEYFTEMISYDIKER